MLNRALKSLLFLSLIILISESKSVAFVVAHDSIVRMVTLKDSQFFKVVLSNRYGLKIINAQKVPIYTESDGIFNFKIVDFNDDGFKDILIEYMTNVPNVQGLLLYDPKIKSYRKVQDFDSFPAAKRIGCSAFYYSYSRSGCADMNWQSDLFYIKDFKIIKIAELDGCECADSGMKNGIYIYNLKNATQLKVETLPISIIKNYKNYKWGFIKQYWTKNYKSFK